MRFNFPFHKVHENTNSHALSNCPQVISDHGNKIVIKRIYFWHLFPKCRLFVFKSEMRRDDCFVNRGNNEDVIGSDDWLLSQL